jgi:hypothetical protein
MPEIVTIGLDIAKNVFQLRIPMKPDAYSKVKPDTCSDFIPDSVPN